MAANSWKCSFDDVVHEEIQMPAGDVSIPAVTFRPRADGRYPAIVMGAEATGVNTFIREVGSKLAHEGYAVVVPDYYRGVGQADPDDYTDVEEIMRHMLPLDFRQAAWDQLHGLDYLRAQSYVDGDHAATWGYCTGATLALLAAELDRTIAASVLFYPSQPVFDDSMYTNHPSDPLDLLWNLRGAALIFYGSDDETLPPTLETELRQRLERWKVDAELVIYPGAGHVFAGDFFGSYRPEADQDSWSRALALLARTLK
jgi:carboxymethylenebutenolidase